MKNRVDFVGIPLDILTMDETINKIDQAIFSNKQVHHCVINAGKVVKIQNDEILKESVINSDIINADGMSIVWSVRFLGYKIQERVAGIDLMENLYYDEGKVILSYLMDAKPSKSLIKLYNIAIIKKF